MEIYIICIISEIDCLCAKVCYCKFYVTVNESLPPPRIQQYACNICIERKGVVHHRRELCAVRSHQFRVPRFRCKHTHITHIQMEND